MSRKREMNNFNRRKSITYYISTRRNFIIRKRRAPHQMKKNKTNILFNTGFFMSKDFLFALLFDLEDTCV